MWPAMCNSVLAFFAVSLTVIAVKLTDDYLDQESDRVLGKFNFTNWLGTGTPVYGLMSLAIGSALAAAVSLPLFFSCYIIGMCHDSHSHYPSGLNGFQESLAVLVLGCCLFGIQVMVFSLLFVFAVQLIDDWLDAVYDRQAGANNYANAWGKTECVLLILGCLGLAYSVNNSLFFPVIIGFIVSYGLIVKIEGGFGHDRLD